ncbi:polyamine aminopropyltransferase [Candidatus Venteria ishoeyi]|uniref:Polyamine aminopropyltransferase n=1 Tax=Candidatus Venteria ishoeyi TaxID=1899563 RepID=A0A1H6FJH0_9GAMM|nr:polyamine aminopropyltransferase [Candidatus Venteria ishoeyi]SEH09226.1 Spermidine synthase [Candidatus Venteria ishoeyi]SEH09351.1 Spermidine synthase [Candidatus Venteria ishoeyi]
MNQTLNQNTTPIPAHFRFTRLFLALSMLVMGTCGIIYEYVLGLMGNNLMGSSHEQIFVIIGIMMFAMGMGAIAQQNLKQHLIDWFLRLELLLGLLGGFGALLTYVAFVYLVNYELVLYALAFVIGALIGLEIPLLIRINSEHTKTLRTNLSDILSMDYVGSLLGALLFTYVLLSHVTLANIALLMGLFNVTIALAGLLFFLPLLHQPRLILLLALLALLLLGTGLFYSPQWMFKLEQRTFEDPIVFSTTSKYQHLVLTQRKDHLRLYLNGHLQFDARDEQIYHEQLVHVPMSLAKQRQRVLILGGGDGLALREVLKYPDVEHITLVDIDPEMIKQARDNPLLSQLNQGAFQDARVSARIAPADNADKVHEQETIYRQSSLANSLRDKQWYELAKVQVYTVDADVFMRQTEGLYDVVLIDFPDPRSVELGKLYSTDFYHSLRQRMQKHALLSVQSTSPYRATAVYLCIAETLRSAGFQVLPYHDYLPSFGDWGWHLAWNDKAQSPDELLQNVHQLPEFSVATRYLTPQRMRAAFAFGKGMLTQPPWLRPNSKMQPVIMAYYAQGFD